MSYLKSSLFAAIPLVVTCTPAREPAPSRLPEPASSVRAAPRAPAASASAASPPSVARVSRAAKGVALSVTKGCAVLEDGGVDCWGGERSLAPERVSGVEDALDVVLAPRMDVAAVLRSGKVRVIDAEGVIRDLSNLGAVTAVSMSLPALCAVLSDGKVVCYRAGTWDEQSKTEPKPDPVAGISDAKAIDLGLHFACVAHASGKVSCFQHTTPAPRPLRASVVPAVADAVQVKVGASMACALRRDRSARCFSLGVIPAKSAELGHADALAVDQDDGYSAPLVCLADGLTVRCQRPEVFGSGYALPSVSTDPVSFTGEAPIRDLAAVNYAVCAMDARGAVACFGHNLGGVLGQPDARFLSTPARVRGLSKIRSVAAGVGFSCALSSAGSVYCWGKSPYSRGAKEAEPDPTVKKVADMPKVERLEASKAYACGFTKSGEASCFFGVENDLRPERTSYRVPLLDSAKQLILPEMGFTNYAAVIDSTGQLLLGPSSGFDTIEKLVLAPVPGFAKVRRIASSYWRLYVEDESGAVTRLDIREGKVEGKPVRLPEMDGATSLGGNGYALLANGAVFEESDGHVTQLRERSQWTQLLDGTGPCGVSAAGELSCWERGPKRERVLARGAKQVSRSMFHRTQTCYVDGQAQVFCLEDCNYGQCGAKVGLFRSDTPVSVLLP